MGQSGFGTFELLVTVAIVAIVSVASISGFSIGMSEQREKTASIKLQQILLRTRNRAQLEAHCASIEANGSEVTIYRYKPGAACLFEPQNLESSETEKLPDGYRIHSASVAQIRFTSTGGLAQGEPVMLRLAGPSGREFRYTIFPAIGQVRLE